MTHLFWGSWVLWVQPWALLLVAQKPFPIGEQHMSLKKINIMDVEHCEILFVLVLFQLTSLIFLVAYISETDRWRFTEE